MAAAIVMMKIISFFTKYFFSDLFHITILLLFSKPAVSSSIIKSLPGFSGALLFKLETGYIEVDEHEERPLKFNMVEYNGSLPTFTLNPHSWTKVSRIIFIDAPVGTGFSYSRSLQGSKTSDTTHAHHCHIFMRKWFLAHPYFITNPLYIAGDSYSGMPVPIVVKYISDGNDIGQTPQMNIKGYLLGLLGNPATDPKFDGNARIPFVHRMTLISDELYKTKINCKGDYTKDHPINTLCAKDLKAVSECTDKINEQHVLEPYCPGPGDPRKARNTSDSLRNLQEEYMEFLIPPVELYQFGCRGTVKAWKRCKSNILYTKDVHSSIGYHRYLSTKDLRVLVYSGDHDMVFPYLGTLRWIKRLNSTIVNDWRPWLVDDQIAGEQDTAPEYEPKNCFDMFERWILGRPLYHSSIADS